jgi:hypothetical protein
MYGLFIVFKYMLYSDILLFMPSDITFIIKCSHLCFKFIFCLLGLPFVLLIRIIA